MNLIVARGILFFFQVFFEKDGGKGKTKQKYLVANRWKFYQKQFLFVSLQLRTWRFFSFLLFRHFQTSKRLMLFHKKQKKKKFGKITFKFSIHNETCVNSLGFFSLFWRNSSRNCLGTDFGVDRKHRSTLSLTFKYARTTHFSSSSKAHIEMCYVEIIANSITGPRTTSFSQSTISTELRGSHRKKQQHYFRHHRSGVAQKINRKSIFSPFSLSLQLVEIRVLNGCGNEWEWDK